MCANIGDSYELSPEMKTLRPPYIVDNRMKIEATYSEFLIMPKAKHLMKEPVEVAVPGGEKL
jgi:hypothetical protein